MGLNFKADPPPGLFALLVGEWDIRTTHPNFSGYVHRQGLLSRERRRGVSYPNAI